ncbi:MAG: MFS transporter [Erythrobacter sp.]
MADGRPEGQSTRFFFLYALALAGGTIAYVPFLSILLPMQVATLAGEEAKVAWLAYLTFAGAFAASVAGIGFGWLSDRIKARPPLVIAGLVLSSLVLAAFGRATSFGMLLGMLIIWQIALNLMLAPLAAWAGDYVPDHQKGTLGGWLAMAPAAGAMATAFVTWPGLASADQRLWLVAALAAALVLPGVLLARPRAFPALRAAPAPQQASGAGALIASLRSPAVARMWLARLLVQIAQAALFAFLYFWLRALDQTFDDARIARLYGAVLLVSIPVTLLAGRWSDKHARPLAPLPVTATIAAGGLIAMAFAETAFLAVIGYVVFALATAVFLALHSAQTLRVLTDPARRAEHLGWFNLTNTAPAMIMPWLTLAVEPTFGFAGLFMILAGCTLLAAVLLARIPRSGPQNPA